jgi:hypothetical protein
LAGKLGNYRLGTVAKLTVATLAQLRFFPASDGIAGAFTQFDRLGAVISGTCIGTTFERVGAIVLGERRI